MAFPGATRAQKHSPGQLEAGLPQWAAGPGKAGFSFFRNLISWGCPGDRQEGRAPGFIPILSKKQFPGNRTWKRPHPADLPSHTAQLQWSEKTRAVCDPPQEVQLLKLGSGKPVGVFLPH